MRHRVEKAASRLRSSTVSAPEGGGDVDDDVAQGHGDGAGQIGIIRRKAGQRGPHDRLIRHPDQVDGKVDAVFACGQGALNLIIRRGLAGKHLARVIGHPQAAVMRQFADQLVFQSKAQIIQRGIGLVWLVIPVMATCGKSGPRNPNPRQSPKASIKAATPSATHRPRPDTPGQRAWRCRCLRGRRLKSRDVGHHLTARDLDPDRVALARTLKVERQDLAQPADLDPHDAVGRRVEIRPAPQNIDGNRIGLDRDLRAFLMPVLQQIFLTGPRTATLPTAPRPPPDA